MRLFIQIRRITGGGSVIMKQKIRLKRILCLFFALVLMNTAGFDTAQALEEEGARMKAENNKSLYTPGTPCIVPVSYPARDVVVADIIRV
jgi:hypothetical protein